MFMEKQQLAESLGKVFDYAYNTLTSYSGGEPQTVIHFGSGGVAENGMTTWFEGNAEALHTFNYSPP